MSALPKLNLLHYFFSLNRRGRWIAHCLNFDIVTAADDLDEAGRRLDVLVKTHIESVLKSNGRCTLSERAPKDFWTRYTNSLRAGGALPSRTLRIEVPEVVPMPMPYGELEVVEARAA